MINLKLHLVHWDYSCICVAGKMNKVASSCFNNIPTRANRIKRILKTMFISMFTEVT